MKAILIFVISSLCLVGLHGQTFTDKKGDIHLWGKCNLEDIKGENYIDWYTKNYEDFNPAPHKGVSASLNDVKVKIFIGSWCGDTKFLLPKFIKSWEAMNLPLSQLEFVAVHYEGELYKQGPNKETAGLNIHRVPTFIFEKEGKEIGRIVERSVHDLDTDIKCIAMGHAYNPRYIAVKMMDEVLKENALDSLSSESFQKMVSKKLRREISSPFELNTYAWVLFTEKRMEEAEFVFQLNSKLFKYEPYIRESYGRCLMKNKKWEEAKKEYLESLRIEPDNKMGVKRLAEIYNNLGDKS